MTDARGADRRRHRRSLDAAYFDRLYDGDADPWRFASSDYERDKYDVTMAALSQARYRHGFEVGCSIGILTARLAARCDRVLAIDGSAAPLDEARRLCAGLSNVTLERRMVPRDYPEGRFDLILLSEVVYYWDQLDLRRMARLVGGSLAPNGDLILVHWLGATDYPLSGDDAAGGLIDAVAAFTRVLTQHRTSAYRLDVLRRS